MPRPMEILGMGPTREATKVEGGWVVRVTPPAWSGFGPSSLKLTDDQYERYVAWREGRIALIQEALPDLSADKREVLLSGIGSMEWDAKFADDGE